MVGNLNCLLSFWLDASSLLMRMGRAECSLLTNEIGFFGLLLLAVVGTGLMSLLTDGTCVSDLMSSLGDWWLSVFLARSLEDVSSSMVNSSSSVMRAAVSKSSRPNRNAVFCGDPVGKAKGWLERLVLLLLLLGLSGCDVVLTFSMAGRINA